MANLSPNTKQIPWFPDHAPSSLSGMTLRRDTSIIKELVIPDEPERAIWNPFRRVLRKTDDIAPKASNR
ncbi:TPA: hypothetical protein RQJ80_001443 [Vibrio vulnificus]|uniref:Uncharacterized protein n=2 Tax=Vibrio vulnificus TaxID=672 RepID=A0A3Q0L115_VIBVU|nr:hypothetical protein [Vibrio vulnificus]AAO08525.1 Hypothetical protein VV2_1668 [Vibrio vulnificus CMCP6]ELA3111239.1 hypothetical protein [Vibrio vulnificus]ELB7530210.1 hypothetical protein [Vibrio vulnificus]MCA3969365.1 hypothetical protein [Vibrio vulnificus]NVC42325.1 hypothetical protein [Vibrio vulnificus]